MRAMEIWTCPVPGIRNLDTLVDAIAEGRHAMEADQSAFARRLGLPDPEQWDWDELACAITEGRLTAEAVDQEIHRGLRLADRLHQR